MYGILEVHNVTFVPDKLMSFIGEIGTIRIPCNISVGKHQETKQPGNRNIR
jgi:hypothetical protein